MSNRCAWAQAVLALNHRVTWYFRRVVWTDICNTILPRTEKKATDQALARKGGKGWISEGCEGFSSNLRGRPEVLHQNSWDAERVWWCPVLTRGKLHLEVLAPERVLAGPRAGLGTPAGDDVLVKISVEGYLSDVVVYAHLN